MTETILSIGFPNDIDSFSINMPAEVGAETPRQITRVTRSRYGPLFVPGPEGGYLHRFQTLTALEEPDDGDIQVVRRGAIAITPLRLDFSGSLANSRLGVALARSGGEA
jgi:broad specificity polyphosphatase/5'/3'-nucleotidase SurE